MEKRVLLVDDEKEFVSTLAERLSLRKIKTAIATDGNEALQIIESDCPDIVLLDLKMPGLDGLEVLKQIKAINKRIKVLILTGHGSTREGIEGMRLGAFDYLMKPIDIDDLILKLEEAAAS